jgi:hypothetical protein
MSPSMPGSVAENSLKQPQLQIGNSRAFVFSIFY